MTLTLIFDVVVAALLVATIWYCAALNRRLNALRRNEDEMRRLVAGLNDAAARAEAAVIRLKESGRGVDEALKEQMGEARALYDELAFLTARGDRLMARFDAGASGRPPGAGRAAGAAGGSADSSQMSRAERELLEALDSAR